MLKSRFVIFVFAMLFCASLFAQTVFEENFNSYSVGEDPNTHAGGIWRVFGLEVAGRSVQGIFISQNSGTPNNWLRISFDSDTGKTPTVPFGIAPYENFEWNPNKDFTNCVLSFDIRSNLASIKPQVLSIEIKAPVQNTNGVPIYEADGVTPLVSTFRIPDSSFRSIPDYKQGWVTVSCNVSILRDPEKTWARPILTQVKEMKIIVYQIKYDLIGKGYVEIDNIKAVR